VLLAAALLYAGAANAALPLPQDGWASWDVAVPGGTENRCCFNWKRHQEAKRVACELDGRDNGFGSLSGDERIDAIRVYARFTGGRLEKLRALGPACAVNTATPVRSLGIVASSESAQWLASQVPAVNERLAEDALASLAAHRGASSPIIQAATTDKRSKVRSQAWFWLSQTAAPETEAAIMAALKAETDRHVREQAVFALSQLPADRAARALIAVASDRTLSREDRKQAVFWMGEVKSDVALDYLDSLLTKN
jgi:hypothetical protein